MHVQCNDLLTHRLNGGLIVGDACTEWHRIKPKLTAEHIIDHFHLVCHGHGQHFGLTEVYTFGSSYLHGLAYGFRSRFR